MKNISKIYNSQKKQRERLEKRHREYAMLLHKNPHLDRDKYLSRIEAIRPAHKEEVERHLKVLERNKDIEEEVLTKHLKGSKLEELPKSRYWLHSPKYIQSLRDLKNKHASEIKKILKEKQIIQRESKKMFNDFKAEGTSLAYHRQKFEKYPEPIRVRIIKEAERMHKAYTWGLKFYGVDHENKFYLYPTYDVPPLDTPFFFMSRNELFIKYANSFFNKNKLNENTPDYEKLPQDLIKIFEDIRAKKRIEAYLSSNLIEKPPYYNKLSNKLKKYFEEIKAKKKAQVFYSKEKNLNKNPKGFEKLPENIKRIYHKVRLSIISKKEKKEKPGIIDKKEAKKELIKDKEFLKKLGQGNIERGIEKIQELAKEDWYRKGTLSEYELEALKRIGYVESSKNVYDFDNNMQSVIAYRKSGFEKESLHHFSKAYFTRELLSSTLIKQKIPGSDKEIDAVIPLPNGKKIAVEFQESNRLGPEKVLEKVKPIIENFDILVIVCKDTEKHKYVHVKSKRVHVLNNPEYKEFVKDLITAKKPLQDSSSS